MLQMKRLIVIASIIASVFGVGVSFAEDSALVIPSGFELKQGAIAKWNDGADKLENLTTVTVARTRPVEAWGKWNALWAGWTVDLGAVYDANTLDTVAVLLGREFGTIGDYLPIDFPLADKVAITLYPVGIYADDVFDDMSVSGATGVGIVKFDVEF